MRSALPIPPENLRIWVGPFSGRELFEESAKQTVVDMVRLGRLEPDSCILEVGCGCGRLARELAGRLDARGSYHGFDVAPPLVDWCKQHLEPLLPNFRFSLQHLAEAGRAENFRFPFPDAAFDLAIVASVFTHMFPAEIENYVAQLQRVLKPSGQCFITLFLFDEAAEAAVARGTTLFNFRYQLGPCLTFDTRNPREGIACNEAWFLDLLTGNGFDIDAVERGDWRGVRSYAVAQDRLVAGKRHAGEKGSG